MTSSTRASGAIPVLTLSLQITSCSWVDVERLLGFQTIMSQDANKMFLGRYRKTLRFQTIMSQDISLKPGVGAQNQVTLNAGKLLLKESKSEPINIDHVCVLPSKSLSLSPLYLLGLTWGGCCLSGRRARGERPAAPPMAPRPNKPETLWDIVRQCLSTGFAKLSSGSISVKLQTWWYTSGLRGRPLALSHLRISK